MQEMVLSGMSHLGDAVEADGHSISGIHRTHYMDPWPWVFYFFVFLFIFRLVGFSWRFDVVVFPCLFHITDLNISTEPSGDLRQVLWGETHCLQVPRTAKKLLSIPVSGCEKLREKRFCISQQGAEQNRDMNCWCWKPYKNRKVLMEKILWAPVHRVQIPMHELPTLLYSNHRCLTIGFNVQVMSALMPIVLLKVRKPPKNKQIMDVKVSSGKKNIVAGGRICLLLKEFYISGKISRGNDEREDTPPSLPDPRGQLQTREEILSQCASFLKKRASWKSHESAVKTPHDLTLLWWVGDSFAQLVFELGANHPWHPNVFLDFCLVNSCFSYRKSIWMATRFLGMSVYICHHDLGRHPKFPNQTSLRWKSWISFDGIRTSTNHGGILHSHAMRNYCEIEWL